MNINRLWYQSHWLSYLLRPLSFLYRVMVALRRQGYRWGFKKTTRFSVPVIVVGNITVGGTGKTPLVAWLAASLKAKGYRPGIVSRGYGGQAHQWPQAVTELSAPEWVGDEPVLLARHARCPVMVGPDRVAAVHALLSSQECDLIISDDGMQHYAMHRDLEIAVLDGVRQFGNGFCLPSGPLREPLSRLKEVDFLVSNGVDRPGYYHMELIPGLIYNIVDPSCTMSIEEAQLHQWHAVAGIGYPERFFNQLKAMGLDIQEHPYPDHHRFSRDDLSFDVSKWVIMTEKDAVKCTKYTDKRHWCLPVTAKLPSDLIDSVLKKLLN